MVLEKPLESPFDNKEVKPVNPKGNQSWIFRGRTDAEAETPVLWPPDAKNWLPGKDPDAEKDWRWEEKGNGREWDGWMASLTGWAWFWAPLGVVDGQGSLACCSSWCRKEAGLTERLNWTDWTEGLYTCRMSEYVKPEDGRHAWASRHNVAQNLYFFWYINMMIWYQGTIGLKIRYNISRSRISDFFLGTIFCLKWLKHESFYLVLGIFAPHYWGYIVWNDS